jgi:NADPH:quinone reductase-like Zn-dependent oxidoreductase
MALENTKLLLRGQGSPLEAITTAKPTITEPNEVMIRLKAIAINPADCKMIDQGQRVTSWPLVPGLDGAGVVEAVGDSVKNFAFGDEVLAMFTAGDRGCAFQNFAVVQETMVAKKPKTWSFEDAATLGYLPFFLYLLLPFFICCSSDFFCRKFRFSGLKCYFMFRVCFLTGLVSLGIGLKISLPFLTDGPKTDVKPSSVLILGGSSAVGAAAIQLLRLATPECTILTTSSPKHHSHITNQLGADKAFDRNSPSLIMDVKSATMGSRGVDAIIDTVGAGSTQRRIFEALDSNGLKRYAQVWTGDEEIDVPSGVDSILFRGRDIIKLQGGKNIMLALQTLLEEGKYKLPLPVHKVGNGFDSLEKGLQLMRKGVSGEKLVVTI